MKWVSELLRNVIKKRDLNMKDFKEWNDGVELSKEISDKMKLVSKDMIYEILKLKCGQPKNIFIKDEIIYETFLTNYAYELKWNPKLLRFEYGDSCSNEIKEFSDNWYMNGKNSPLDELYKVAMNNLGLK
jgi:hypothetical protein